MSFLEVEISIIELLTKVEDIILPPWADLSTATNDIIPESSIFIIFPILPVAGSSIDPSLVALVLISACKNLSSIVTLLVLGTDNAFFLTT